MTVVCANRECACSKVVPFETRLASQRAKKLRAGKTYRNRWILGIFRPNLNAVKQLWPESAPSFELTYFIIAAVSLIVEGYAYTFAASVLSFAIFAVLLGFHSYYHESGPKAAQIELALFSHFRSVLPQVSGMLGFMAVIRFSISAVH